MGGQAGFSRDMLAYSSDSNTLMAGLKYGADKKMQLGIDLSWMQADAALAPFDLPADDYVAITPPMSYDFSQSHTYSDINSTRTDVELWGTFRFATDWWVRLRYHMVDYKDDAPYLYDTSGSYTFAAAALGVVF